jgi:phosphatidylserine/phosphatidylglycerophosphate/cardiolipin synthase-like enzyme
VTASALALVLLLAAGPQVQVLETGPLGSELDQPPVRNALAAFPEFFNQARKTIDIAEMYVLYYPPESKGRAVYPLYDALIAAAQRGVRVRVLLDSTTLESGAGETYLRMRRALSEVPGIEVRACDLRRFSRYHDCLMHAKYFVVDGRLAVIGSHNWSFAGFTDNVELSLAIDDSTMAGQLAQVFETDWRPESKSPDGDSPGLRADAKPHRGQSPRFGSPTVVVTGPSALRDSSCLSTHDALSRVCAAADATFDIIVNSISTRVDFGTGPRYGFVDSLLRDADRRKVRVRLLVDKWALEHDSALLRSLDSLPNVEARVADISALGPNQKTGSVHAKLVIADRKTVLLGSATFSQRQIEECRNVGVLLSDTATAAVLTDLFERNWFSVFCRKP